MKFVVRSFVAKERERLFFIQVNFNYLFKYIQFYYCHDLMQIIIYFLCVCFYFGSFIQKKISKSI